MISKVGEVRLGAEKGKQDQLVGGAGGGEGGSFLS